MTTTIRPHAETVAVSSTPADSLFIVQISDIHVGDSLDAAVLNRSAGLRGHDPLLCRLLATRIQEIASLNSVNEKQLRWIVSGDLTRVGGHAEFTVARDFLESVPPRDALGRPIRPTLGVPRNRYMDVPGNHDHFAGWDEDNLRAWAYASPPPAWNNALFPAIFARCPCDNLAEPWDSAGGSIRLELFGVDSCSGLAGQKANRFASGQISDHEFSLLELALRTSNDVDELQGVTRVRAIVCHHAFSKTPQAGLFKASPLCRASRKRLRLLGAQYRVAAILTGHTHARCFQKFNERVVRYGESGYSESPIYELRCPTTLQGLASGQGFWVHRLVRQTPEVPVVWEPRLYLLSGGDLQPQPVNAQEDFPAP